MLKTLITFVFSAALFINAALFVPQAWRIYKERRSKEISLFTFGGFLFIQSSTVLYGLMHRDYILVAGYLLSILTCGTVVILALIFRDARDLN